MIAATTINSDALLDELGGEDFSDLDELLAESMSEAEEKLQYAEDLKARKRGFTGMSKEEVDFCNSRMQAFEQARIWRPIKNLAVFARIECACGESRLIFGRWMQQQVSRTNPTARRWDTVPAANKHLPTESAYEVRKTPICPVCAVMQDIDTHNAVSLLEAMK